MSIEKIERFQRCFSTFRAFHIQLEKRSSFDTHTLYSVHKFIEIKSEKRVSSRCFGNRYSYHPKRKHKPKEQKDESMCKGSVKEG